MTLTSPNLLLRPWRESDFPGFCALNQDPAVMEFFPHRLAENESRIVFDRVKQRVDENGWGFWAVEINREFAGLIGLARPDFAAPFTPCVEVGWRLHKKFWGQSFAFEGARLSLQYGFDSLGLAEIVAFTARLNLRSQRLMQRLGMSHKPADDFLHPKIPVGHPIQPHVLYRLTSASFNNLLDERALIR